MRGFADIHTHILPCVDDGAVDVAQALEMARMAWQNGTRVLYLTPHYHGQYWHCTNQELANIFGEFRQQLAAELPEMQVFLGSELCFEVDLAEKLQNQEVFTLGQSRYILLEFPFELLRFQMISGITELVRCGYVPIIAHVERCGVFYQCSDLLDEVLESGALLQINAGSIMGERGFGIKRFCHKLLKSKRCILLHQMPTIPVDVPLC